MENFEYLNEKFADIQMLRYNIPGFENLSLNRKVLSYYLYEAALSGRDIMWDQNCAQNLTVRRTLEAIWKEYKGNREISEFKNLEIYLKRVWFSNGIHHHYSSKKFIPGFSKQFFVDLVTSLDITLLPIKADETLSEFVKRLTEIIFNEEIMSKRVTHAPDCDLIQNSANGFYEGVSQKEVEEFYENLIDKNDKTPISYGLNSKLVKKSGKIEEQVYSIKGMYKEAIGQIVFWLNKAVEVAENEGQKRTLQLLIKYYETGNLRLFDEYNIEWLKDTESVIDTVNGFIEVYGDALSMRGAFEAIVSMRDEEATKRIKAISDTAQWFEDNSPIQQEHKKKEVTGVTAKVITVIVESGDSSPATPIGINLPNADWIRKEYGSKSVNLSNIVHAYNVASANSGMVDEFVFSKEEKERAKTHGPLAGDLHTDLHEVIGHGSGQILEGVGSPNETLRNYHSVLEEVRADLVALYYLPDNKMVEIGLIDSPEVAKAEYDAYIRNGLITQLVRIELGDDLEQAHMRCRKLIASWAYAAGQSEEVIEKITHSGKTYFRVNDYDKLRSLFGSLLREVQRIKSEGDYEAGKSLVEQYAVKIDYELHKEVLERYKTLNIAPYMGFINPVLQPILTADGTITDIKVIYPDSFSGQMMYYAEKYSFLPTVN